MREKREGRARRKGGKRPTLRAIINDQVEAMRRSWHFSCCVTLPRNHEVMRTFWFFKTESYHRRSRLATSRPLGERSEPFLAYEGLFLKVYRRSRCLES